MGGAPSVGSSIGPIKPPKAMKPLKPMTATAYGTGSKANVPMPAVAGGRPDYKASGSFKPKLPQLEPPGAMKM